MNTMKVNAFRTAVTAMLAVALTACGGGGNGETLQDLQISQQQLDATKAMKAPSEN